ncbi:MAG: response regulator transcription factor [Kineosporiaceae bacterium]
MRVLVVEDEVFLADAVARGLRREGIAVDLASDGAEALEKVAVTDYDVVVLDRDLPRVHGDDVCRRLVTDRVRARILRLTASGTDRDVVTGLTIGADDYLPKPFAFPVLVARLRALARRSQRPQPPVLRHGDLVCDPARRVATRGDELLALTRKEFGVLQALLEAGGAVVSSEELLEQVWDEHTDPFTTVVRVTVRSLRLKLGDPPVVETVIGAGYRIASADPMGSAS